MLFYLGMMPKTVCDANTAENLNKDTSSKDVSDSNRAHNSKNDKKRNDGEICYPLCEKKFKEGDILRTILPCGHVFHERCIKIWLFRGEN